MTRRPHLLIVNSEQFGYHTDTLNYCRYLRDRFRITYIGWDYGLPTVTMEGVTVIEVSREGGKVRRTLRLVRRARRQIATEICDLIFVVYFRACSLVPRGFPGDRFIMDVRSGCVHASGVIRRIENQAIRLESRGFRHLTVISESLRKYLRLDAARSVLLPLGGERWEIKRQRLEALRLLYVGTLNLRNIERTIPGFASLYRQHGKDVDMTYDIVGGGDQDAQERLKEAIAGSGCEDIIHYHGQVPHPSIRPFVERGTVGVAFFPSVEYFEYQPVTKVFECLLAGMPVIATATHETRLVVDDRNGVLCVDTEEGFAEALNLLFERRAIYEPEEIIAGSLKYSWESIVRTTLQPFLESLHRGVPDA
jgi:glycosyltransferase involved in cell wall biosynthesis